MLIFNQIKMVKCIIIYDQQLISLILINMLS